MHFHLIISFLLTVETGIPPEAIEEPVFSFGDRLNSFRFFRRKRSVKSSVLPYNEPAEIEFDEAWKEYQNRGRSKRSVQQLNEIYGDTSCQILGVKYSLGEVIGVASDICMECRCAAGSMFCTPKCCFQPAPFSINRSQQNNLLKTARTGRHELRSHPLHYIKNQYVSSNFI